MNVLVTGGAGFIGAHVVNYLITKGHNVSVLDNLSLGIKENVNTKANLIIGDIGDADVVTKSLQNIDAVIHMAGLIVVEDSVKDPIKYSQVNVLGTVTLLDCMRKENVKKFIFSSSACVYGTPEKLPITENEPIKPDNPYGATKAAVETFLQAFSVNYNMDTIILRYFNPYGPGEMHIPETHAIPSFIKAALAKRPIPLYWNGEQIRDFIYIDDLVKAHVDVLDLHGYQIFNVGTENGIKVKDVVEKIFNIVGYKVPIEDLGERAGDVMANYASSAKINKSIGWQAKTSLEDGLRKTIQFYKDTEPSSH